MSKRRRQQVVTVRALSTEGGIVMNDIPLSKEAMGA